jgi:long-chain acyl-CoA synthetase
MRARGIDAWPSDLTAGIRAERRLGRDVPCYADRPRGLTALLDRAVERAPDREAIVDATERLSWRTVDDRAWRLAAGLARLGVGPGDRVAMLLSNGAPFCLTTFATLRLGALAVPLSTKLRREELRFLLANSAPRVLVADPAFYGEIEPLRGDLPGTTCVLTGDGGAVGTTAFAALLGAPPRTVAPPPDATTDDAPALLLYTSGTTGRPKGAVVTHGNVVHSCVTFERVYGLRAGERSLVMVPLVHVTGLVAQLWAMTAVAGAVVLMPRFDAGDALRLLADEGITHMVGAPTVYVMLMARPDHRAAPLPRLRVLGYGGAPMASDTVRMLREWLPGARLHNTYGLTETASPATCLADGDALTRIHTVGRPVPVGECRTVDPANGRESGAGEVGELWVRGPMVVAGYWENPAATTTAIVEDGWLRTGDLATIDAEGYVAIRDRIKDMVNRGGEKVYCVEVEEVLCAHPGVLEAAVVGLPDPVYGERVKACLVARPGARLEAADVQAWTRERLARFKVPEIVEILEALPRNPNGKVMKALLRQSA